MVLILNVVWIYQISLSVDTGRFSDATRSLIWLNAAAISRNLVLKESHGEA